MRDVLSSPNPAIVAAKARRYGPLKFGAGTGSRFRQFTEHPMPGLIGDEVA